MSLLTAEKKVRVQEKEGGSSDGALEDMVRERRYINSLGIQSSNGCSRSTITSPSSLLWGKRYEISLQQTSARTITKLRVATKNKDGAKGRSGEANRTVAHSGG